jgi:hypothetical protein
MAAKQAKVFAESNEAIENTGTGGEQAHSSLERSTLHTAPGVAGDHEQQDDELQNIPPPQDPNISGTPATEDTVSWQAGAMSSWQENDDYRHFLESGATPESVLYKDFGYTEKDGDYDDNGGIPTAIGHDRGQFGQVIDVTRNPSSDHAERSDGFSLGPIVRRI